jgi:hypothetical protein
MIEQNITICDQGHRLESIVNVFGFGFSFSAVIAACCFGFFIKMPIPIENTVILILALSFVLLPLKPEKISTLQKIICFYLFSVIVNQISAQYFPISISSANISVSYSIVPLLLCGSGYFVGKANSTSIARVIESRNIFYAWTIALAIIIVHIIFLSVILNKFYGYGFERNLSTVGNLTLYLLLFILLWEKLGSIRFRRSMGLVLAFFYLISIFCK